MLLVGLKKCGMSLRRWFRHTTCQVRVTLHRFLEQVDALPGLRSNAYCANPVPTGIPWSALNHVDDPPINERKEETSK